MKNNIYIFISILILFTSGCSDLLEEDNKGGITNEEFYSTVVGYNTLVTASYASLRTIYGNAPIWDLGGTDIYQEGKDPGGPFYRYESLNAGNTELKNFYQDCYKAIQNTNTALFYLNQPPLTESEKEQAEAELRFLRAFYHFILIEQFGGIVINQEYTNSPRVDIPRSNLTDSYEFVISEMEAALPDVPAESDPGRVDQSVVNHYLAKAYLTRAWDLGSENDFNSAISYADAVIDNKGPIELSYEDVWDPFNENNEEVIFSVQYSLEGVANLQEGGNSQQTLYAVYSGSGSGNMKRSVDAFVPSHHLISSFQENDSRYWFNFMLTTYNDYFNFYPDGPSAENGPVLNYYPVIKDPNKTSLTAADSAEWDAYVNSVGGKADGYLVFPIWAGASDFHKTQYEQRAWGNTDRRLPAFKKFDDPVNALNGNNNNASTRSIVLARLAGTYFLKAEALIGLGQFNEARDVVQVIIDRPGNEVDSPGDDINNALDGVSDQTEALEAYFLETGKEMLGEYNGRWPMLRRTNMLGYMLEKYNADFDRNGITWQSHWDLRPIPQDAIQLNEAMTFEEDQNPGY